MFAGGWWCGWCNPLLGRARACSLESADLLSLPRCVRAHCVFAHAHTHPHPQVAVLRGQPVFRVRATQLIKPADAKFDAGEQR